MTIFRAPRRLVALIAAYALALQPLVATLAWQAHPMALAAEQGILCLAGASGGTSDRSLPGGADRACGCCTASMCSAGGCSAELPQTAITFITGNVSLAAAATPFVVRQQTLALERYRPRAPPLA